jgi:hypothetical protein
VTWMGRWGCVRSGCFGGHGSIAGVGGEEADRAISIGKLHALLHFHFRPIDVVVCHGSDRETLFQGGFPA